MPLNTRQKDIFNQGSDPKGVIDTVTIGTVVDTNDPQEMGRIRAVCPQWGDSNNTPVEQLPWSLYATPFGGQVSVGARGPGLQDSQGGVAYGMWAIPKIGARVLMMCIDGDPMHRVYVGCVYDQFTPHTLPHGRWMYDEHPELDKRGVARAPYGPYTSREHPVQPLYDNLQQAFGSKGDPNHEWRTRAADYTASALSLDSLSHTYSKVADDKGIAHEGWTSTQGYQSSRIDPHAHSSLTSKNYDSQVYSITSPGFHSVSMDDRQENCRMRFRTSAGHQIIMDDTNERIYIATAKGNNWIEMDQDGNIDIFSANKVSVRSSGSINMTSDDTIRMHGAKGIHMYSGGDVRVEATTDISVRAKQSMRVHASESVYLQADQDAHIRAGQSLYAQASQEANITAGSNANLTAGATINLLASDALMGTAAVIHLNGPGAAPAAPADTANEQPAMWTSRVPSHEPFARCMTASDFSHEPEFAYDDANNNRSERGRTIPRGLYWRR